MSFAFQSHPTPRSAQPTSRYLPGSGHSTRAWCSQADLIQRLVNDSKWAVCCHGYSAVRSLQPPSSRLDQLSLHILPHPKGSHKNGLKLYLYHQSLTPKWKESPGSSQKTLQKPSCDVLSMAHVTSEQSASGTRATHRVHSGNTDTLELRLALAQSRDRVEWVSPPVTGTLESVGH